MSAPDRATIRTAAASRGPARRLAVAAAAIAIPAVTAAAVLLAGCAKFDAALGQQWAVVQFKSDTPVATVLKVRAACSHVPNVLPEALPKVRTELNMINAVQFRTDNASDANLAVFQGCLQKFPSVAGINFQDAGDSG